MRERLERHQVLVYLVALMAGLSVGTHSPVTLRHLHPGAFAGK